MDTSHLPVWQQRAIAAHEWVHGPSKPWVWETPARYGRNLMIAVCLEPGCDEWASVINLRPHVNRPEHIPSIRAGIELGSEQRCPWHGTPAGAR